MSAESIPEDCPLYLDPESAYFTVKDIEYVAKDLGPIHRTVMEEKAECMARFLPEWRPNEHNNAPCRRCNKRIDVTPSNEPWGRS